MTGSAAPGPGRRLFLCTDPALVRGQLDGHDLARTEADALRDNIFPSRSVPVQV